MGALRCPTLVGRPLLLMTLLAGSACARPPTKAPSAFVHETLAPQPSVPLVAPGRPEGVDVGARPCPRGSDAAGAASSALAVLSARIAALPPEDDPRPLATALRHVFEGPCFALAQLDEPNWDFTSSLSLRAFWQNGGEAWAGGFLALGAGEPQGRVTWIPPTPRRALTREATPRHPLAPWLLCAEGDEACGRDTEPWARRAATYFRLFDDLRRAQGSPPAADPRATCAARALSPGTTAPYAEWLSCVEEGAERHTAMPLGRFRAPREGWLFVRGRRGHHAFCDEVRAYDLETGAAFVAQSCSGLRLRTDGSVDGAQTDAARKVVTRAGQLDVPLLREAAWMMALGQEAERDVLEEGFGWSLPDGIEPVAGSGASVSVSTSSTSDSGQTQLEWQWIARGARVTAGTITWPRDYDDAARDHAVKLLDIAEASFREGCAPAPPPTGVPATKTVGGVSELDGSAESLRGAQDELARAIVGLRATRCKR